MVNSELSGEWTIHKLTTHHIQHRIFFPPIPCFYLRYKS